MGASCSCLSKVEANDCHKSRDDPPSTGSASHEFTLPEFTLSELRDATAGFSELNVVGEGGYAKVYRGNLKDGQIVAIKFFFGDRQQGNQEFNNELKLLSKLRHPNVVRLIGFCEEGCNKLLVYEYMEEGSLADHLFDRKPSREPLDWRTRLNIAVGVAQGLQYLHRRDPPIIHRDIKSSNILLDHKFRAKLGDLGLAKLGPHGGETHVSTRVMGTHGYCAPDYLLSGKLNFKSDIYCLGVVLLELITGRTAVDPDKPPQEQELVIWAGLFLQEKERKKRLQLIDPSLMVGGGGGVGVPVPRREASRFIVIAENCLHKYPNRRPQIGEVLEALNFLASKYNPLTSSST